MAGVKNEVVGYFAAHFAERGWLRTKLDGIYFKSVSVTQNNSLVNPFSIEEIEESLSCCEGDKSLGSDGFNLMFVKSCWEILKYEVLGLFQDFFRECLSPKGDVFMLSYLSSKELFSSNSWRV